MNGSLDVTVACVYGNLMARKKKKHALPTTAQNSQTDEERAATGTGPHDQPSGSLLGQSGPYQ